MQEPHASQPLSLLDVDEQTASPTTLAALAAGKPLVIDFWHTRCVRCPEALSKLDGIAESKAGEVQRFRSVRRRRARRIRSLSCSKGSGRT